MGCGASLAPASDPPPSTDGAVVSVSSSSSVAEETQNHGASKSTKEEAPPTAAPAPATPATPAPAALTREESHIAAPAAGLAPATPAASVLSGLSDALELFLGAPALQRLYHASAQQEKRPSTLQSSSQCLPELPEAWTCQVCNNDGNSGGRCRTTLARCVYEMIKESPVRRDAILKELEGRRELRLRRRIEVNSFVKLLGYPELEKACEVADLPLKGLFEDARRKVAGNQCKVLEVRGSGLDDTERIKVKVPGSGVVYIGLGACKEWQLPEDVRDAVACAFSTAICEALPKDVQAEAKQFGAKLEAESATGEELCSIARAVELWGIAGCIEITDHEEMVMTGICVAQWYLRPTLATVESKSTAHDVLLLGLFVAGNVTGVSYEFETAAAAYCDCLGLPRHWDCRAMVTALAAGGWRGPWSATDWGRVSQFLRKSHTMEEVRLLLAEAPKGVEWEEPWRALSTLLPTRFPEHWHYRHSRSAFHQMVCIPRRTAQGEESPAYTAVQSMLDGTYMKIPTRDRPCPKRDSPCKPQAGGCSCVQPDGDPGMPDGLRIVRLLRIEDSAMWRAYEDRRDELYQKYAAAPKQDRITVNTDAFVKDQSQVFPPLDFSSTEAYLFHGTPIRAALSIARNDFSIDLAGSNTGTMYGAGCYLADCSSKADEYSRDEPGGYYDGVFAMLICRVAMGRPYIVEDRDPEAGVRVASGEYDSTLGDRAGSVSTYREYVLYDATQVYPEYCVLYRRYGEKMPLPIHAPTLMVQVPAYWNNAHVDPNSDPFDEKYAVSDGTLRFLEWILQENSGLKLSVQSAQQVEDSKMWLQYLECRSQLQESGNFEPPSDLLMPVKAMLKAAAQATADDDDSFGGLPSLGSIAEMLKSNLDLSINACYLWHGTSHEVAEKICEDGFKFTGGSSAGKRFGLGGYFAEDPAKSLEYAPVTDGLQALLFCRVICGKLHHTSGGADVNATTNAKKSGCHATLACPNLGGSDEPREIIVFDEAHVYPEYVLYVKDGS